MFKIGEKVAAINSKEEGRVVKIDGDKITLRCDGFDFIFTSSELISRDAFEVSFTSFDATKTSSAFLRDEKTASFRPKPNGIKHNASAAIIVDLHIERLLAPSKIKYMQPADIVYYQLGHAKKAIERAKKAGNKRLILIHGVGQGSLKAELGYMLKGMPRLRSFDAAFNEFGQGATEVELFG